MLLKFPNTLLLQYDHKKHIEPRVYWLVRHLVQDKINVSFASKFIWFDTPISKTRLFREPYKFTLNHSSLKYLVKISEQQKQFYLKTEAPNPKLKKKLLHSEHLTAQIYAYLVYKDEFVNYKKFLREVLSLRKKPKFTLTLNNKILKHFNLFFFKKERLYTKLKYSRVPQYDAVSGGAAALLAGFLGFLITEKFGLELTDSGDFWFVFLYLSFSFFFLQPLLRMVMDANEDKSVFSISWGLNFYVTLGYCFVNFLSTQLLKLK